MCFGRKKYGDLRTAERLRQLTAGSELSTIEYTIVKVVKAEDKSLMHKLGNRKILYTTRVYVKAGIDLDKYDATKTRVNDSAKSISVVLPHARIISVNMPFKEQTLVYEKVTGLRKDFKRGEVNELLIQGEESVRKDIENMGILEDAESNTREIFKSSLLQLGYETVDIKFE